MLNLYPRPSARSGAGDDDGVDGYRVFYGIAVVCVSIFLFCVLAASVTIWKACAFAAIAALLLSAVGCFVPERWLPRRRRCRQSAELAAVTAGAARQRALANAPPAFAYECPLDLESGGGKPEAASCAVMSCAVCLEDVRGGEMVRQLPACRHVFHVECIDMWLHSHLTCPMCRCVISPPPTVAAAKAAEEEAPESSEGTSLPPV